MTSAEQVVTSRVAKPFHKRAWVVFVARALMPRLPLVLAVTGGAPPLPPPYVGAGWLPCIPSHVAPQN